MNTQERIKTGKQIALFSFLAGTAIFALYFLTSASGLLFVGWGFIVIVGLINLIILTQILNAAYKDKDNRKRLLVTSGLMLLNIPVMLIYCSIAMMLLGIMRITFTNATDKMLTDINIVGCEFKHIDKLEAGETKTVWVGITGDCYIDIEYIIDGERKQENVVGYASGSMGQKIKYNVGGKNDITF